MCENKKEEILKYIEKLSAAHILIEEVLEGKRYRELEYVLAMCQEFAIEAGKQIERVERKNSTKTVKLLEDYCEFLYQHVLLRNSLKNNSLYSELENFLFRIRKTFEKEFDVNTEIIFLPYNARMEHDLEEIYKIAKANERYDIFVVPILDCELIKVLYHNGHGIMSDETIIQMIENYLRRYKEKKKALRMKQSGTNLIKYIKEIDDLMIHLQKNSLNCNLKYDMTFYSIVKKEILCQKDTEILEKNDKPVTIQECIGFLAKCKTKILIELKEFCLIIRNDSRAGFASFMGTNLKSICKCLSQNKIPVIGMEYGQTSFDKERNQWSKFFEQPFGISVTDIPPDSICSVIDDTDYLMEGLWENKSLQAFWHNIFEKYMLYTEDTKKYLEQEYNNFFKGIDINKVVGVLCRGTDYKENKPYGHWIQPEPKDLIPRIKRAMSYYSCEYIFLATEDKKIYQEFLDEFGKEKLIVTKTKMLENVEKQSIIDVQVEEKIDMFQNNLDYLSAMYQLSKLKYFFAGITSGSLVVCMMSGGFEYLYMHNEGRYGIDDKEELTNILNRMPVNIRW